MIFFKSSVELSGLSDIKGQWVINLFSVCVIVYVCMHLFIYIYLF